MCLGYRVCGYRVYRVYRMIEWFYYGCRSHSRARERSAQCMTVGKAKAVVLTLHGIDDVALPALYPTVAGKRVRFPIIDDTEAAEIVAQATFR